MNLLRHGWGRLALFGLLYFSEGAPIGLIWWAMPTFLRSEGVPVAQITALTSSLVLFWAFKFLWAPLIDTLRTRHFGFRGWIFAAQCVMGASLLPLIFVDPAEEFSLFWMLAAVHAFSATVQDVAIDALAIRQVALNQRGSLNGAMQAGMLLGRSLFGGGALLAAALWGWPFVIGALVAAIWTSTVALLFVREQAADEEPATTPPRKSFPATVRAAWRRPETRFGLAFAAVSGAGFEAVGGLAGPFLIDSGASQETVGWFFGVPVVVAMILGGLAGGMVSDRIPRTRSVGLFLTGFVGTILGVAILIASGVTDGRSPVTLLLLTVMYLFVGLFTAASYALFMDLTDPRIGGTQFSAYMSATNACEAWSVWSGGLIAARAGYPASFTVLAIASLVGLPILAGLTKSGRRSGRAES